MYLQNILQNIPGGNSVLSAFTDQLWQPSFTYMFIWLLCQLFSEKWKMCYSFHSLLMPSCFVFCQFLLHLSCRTRAAIIFSSNAFSSRDSLAYLHNPCPYGVAQEKTSSKNYINLKAGWHWLKHITGYLAYESPSVNQHANEHIKVCPTCLVYKTVVTGHLICCLAHAVLHNIQWEGSNIFLKMKAAGENSAESSPASKDRCSADSYLNKEQKFTFVKVLQKLSFQLP